ncbi:TIGR01620 family protein [Shewanella psychrophila]|uniref:TIGR01620 family protein n=1 Tax=Shewanella psychrophila TaxID=225848 RepID=A0A1S6HND8_9GAMM|nr:TIGR01620 family protein [Shewanella psychrophila]AQS37028.1 TIGR01620 family protein [Shewanella psychrophila]
MKDREAAPSQDNIKGAESETENTIKQKQVFESIADEATPSFREAKRFEEQAQFIEIPINSADESVTDEVIDNEVASSLSERSGLFENSSKRKAKPRWTVLAKLIVMGLIGLVITETTLGLRDAWLESPWLFGLYSSVTLLITLWAGKLVFREWRQLVRLKSVEEAQQTGDRLAQSMQLGEADKFIGNIINNLPQGIDLSKYHDSNRDGHNDAEKLILFDEIILSDRDRVAKKIVRRFAQESALLLAASPLAVLDMAIILWRNQSMIVKIAHCYGIELGYWSRIKLIRGVITNIIYAGTSEIATDLGTQLLSVEMSGKLSARLGQGLGGGLLTARLGYQAMALCRPLSFKESSRPKLSGIHKELLLDLKELSSSVFSGKVKEKVKCNKDFTS